jgi:hypothetical protein
MFKKAAFLTHPVPASRDTPFRGTAAAFNILLGSLTVGGDY